jgi:hypothetical protein
MSELIYGSQNITDFMMCIQFSVCVVYILYVCQLLVTGWWFSLSTAVSSTNDITEILLKVALNIINH